MTNTSEVKCQRTPLYKEHLSLKAKMVEFAGWEMPIQYSQLKEEHLNVRKNVGLFDVSHMGEIRVKGPKSLESLQWLTTNDVSKLNSGEAQYSLLPNFEGGLVDDIIIYCLEKNANYLVCVNASNKDKDFSWMIKNNKGADITDESHLWGQIAVQGPKAISLLTEVFHFDVSALVAFKFKILDYHSSPLILATTGYTGEKGAEIFVPAALTSQLWLELLTKGEKYGVLPIGLGARDTLRTEMKYSLYGHEIDDQTNPYAAELGWVIKPQAKDFIGKDLLLKGKEKGLEKKLVGFKMKDKGIPRQGYELYSPKNEPIGKVTSGTHSPSLDEPIGIGYVRSEFSGLGQEFYVDIRGRKVLAQVVKTPFLEK
ncbi:MAG: glycine cleavage system aminomethyltransferase GcvT [Deltaproteobacteria bacterium]|jgi:aminomethyltransferase|nr:glycine cleavage system aminomethyltransferase GcvT [Deltaproteobacteria bacterium]